MKSKLIHEVGKYNNSKDWAAARILNIARLLASSLGCNIEKGLQLTSLTGDDDVADACSLNIYFKSEDMESLCDLREEFYFLREAQMKGNSENN